MFSFKYNNRKLSIFGSQLNALFAFLPYSFFSSFHTFHCKLNKVYFHILNSSTHFDSPILAPLPSLLTITQINAYMNVNNNNVLRQRSYQVNHHIRFGYGFKPIVRSPSEVRDNKPRVRWLQFHEVVKVKGMEDYPDSRALAGVTSAHLMSIAPESHASIRSLYGGYAGMSYSNIERNDCTVVPMDLQRYAAAVGGDASDVTGGGPAEPVMLFPEMEGINLE